MAVNYFMYIKNSCRLHRSECIVIIMQNVNHNKPLFIETVMLRNSHYVKCNVDKWLLTILCTSRTLVVYIDQNALSL